VQDLQESRELGMVAVLERFVCRVVASDNRQSAKRRVVGLCLVGLSLTMYAKRRVAAMQHCRSVQIEGLAYKPSEGRHRNRATS
jgi:hypothetical protein